MNELYVGSTLHNSFVYEIEVTSKVQKSCNKDPIKLGFFGHNSFKY